MKYFMRGKNIHVGSMESPLEGFIAQKQTLGKILGKTLSLLVYFHLLVGEAGRRFRNPKRFMAVPSPIIAVEWWRVN